MSGSLTLCATARLAQTLRGALPGGTAVWRTPPALTVGQWFAALADEALLSGLGDLPQALDPYAEGLLWEKTIAATLSDASPLFDIEGMAAAAAEAHALCRLWLLPAGGTALSDEARLFVGWQAEFERACRAGGWIDATGLHQRLIALIAEGHFQLPERVILAGFDRLSPLEHALIAALSGRGVRVEPAGGGPLDGPEPGTARQLACVDVEAECAAVVAWAAAHRAADPECRIGIVAPDLASLRDRLEFALDDALHPALIRPDAAEAPRAFNFSLGRPLADQPRVRVALDLLALGASRGKVEQARLSALLLAGGWGAAEGEADGRARLDAVLRRDLPYFVSLPAVLRLAERLAEDGAPLCPRTIAALTDFAGLVAAATRKQRPGQWGGFFRRILKAAGWPGDRPLSSHEFQAKRALGEVLESFGRFDAWLGPLSLREAVQRLTQLCRQRLFQPETRGRPAIQVLGVLESAGLEFDALWVMGMNDDRWPPPPRPNPLLPAERQRAFGVARASAEIELDFAERVHARLLRAAPEVRFSWARAEGNRLLRPSPLIAGLPGLEAPPIPVASLAQQWIATAPQLACLDDAQAPPLAAGEKVSGGSWLLRAQAICPAWAYYQYRLGAEAMETPVEGLDPAARGTLVHAALESFWAAVPSSDALGALNEIARRRAVGDAVEQALLSFERARHQTLPKRFRQLEGGRLVRLLDVWLVHEAGRSQPFEVIAREQPAEVDIEGIRVRMVVDRIDRLADGRQVIIDYKTGASIDTRNWAEPRITEPQLPIYAALVNDRVAAVVFAKVRLDKPAFAGIADQRDILPGVQGIGDEKQKLFDPERFPDWAAVVAHWRESLYAVAREIKHGAAAVCFTDEKELQYCEVLPLLRLAERRRLLALPDGLAVRVSSPGTRWPDQTRAFSVSA